MLNQLAKGMKEIVQRLTESSHRLLSVVMFYVTTFSHMVLGVIEHDRKRLDINRIVYVYDRLNPNSLFAAAAVKKYCKTDEDSFNPADIYEVSDLNVQYLRPSIQLVWLGMRPIDSYVKRFSKNTHFALLPRSYEPTKSKRVVVLTADCATATEIVVEVIFKRMLRDFELTESEISYLQGRAFTVSRFYDNDLDIMESAEGCSLIDMALGYLFHYTPWYLDIPGDVNHYMNKVKSAKEMLDFTRGETLHYKYDRFITSRMIPDITSDFFVAWRLVSLTNGIVGTLRIITDNVRRCQNRSEILLAAATA